MRSKSYTAHQRQRDREREKGRLESVWIFICIQNQIRRDSLWTKRKHIATKPGYSRMQNLICLGLVARLWPAAIQQTHSIIVFYWETMRQRQFILFVYSDRTRSFAHVNIGRHSVSWMSSDRDVNQNMQFDSVLCVRTMSRTTCIYVEGTTRRKTKTYFIWMFNVVQHCICRVRLDWHRRWRLFLHGLIWNSYALSLIVYLTIFPFTNVQYLWKAIKKIARRTSSIPTFLNAQICS